MSVLIKTCNWCGSRRRLSDYIEINIQNDSWHYYICSACAEAIHSRLEAPAKDKIKDKPKLTFSDKPNKGHWWPTSAARR